MPHDLVSRAQSLRQCSAALAGTRGRHMESSRDQYCAASEHHEMCTSAQGVAVRFTVFMHVPGMWRTRIARSRQQHVHCFGDAQYSSVFVPPFALSNGNSAHAHVLAH